MSAIAAFFDMDHTIIWENSGRSSARLAKQFNMMTHAQLIKGVFKIVLYRLALLDINKWYESNIAGLKGMPIEDMERSFPACGSRAWSKRRYIKRRSISYMTTRTRGARW
jgi:phosphoserine phosphatase